MDNDDASEWRLFGLSVSILDIDNDEWHASMFTYQTVNNFHAGAAVDPILNTNVAGTPLTIKFGGLYDGLI